MPSARRRASTVASILPSGFCASWSCPSSRWSNSGNAHWPLISAYGRVTRNSRIASAKAWAASPSFLLSTASTSKWRSLRRAASRAMHPASMPGAVSWREDRPASRTTGAGVTAFRWFTEWTEARVWANSTAWSWTNSAPRAGWTGLVARSTPSASGPSTRTSTTARHSSRSSVVSRPSAHVVARDADGPENCTQTKATTTDTCGNGRPPAASGTASPAKASSHPNAWADTTGSWNESSPGCPAADASTAATNENRNTS